ncbi:alpha/beta hydrolase (plasmid) [Paraburkholderia sp. D15]|uniref:alpha/beta fold hydrolase n=1 Tax=Paraburkholderia sp. D15 TaxID=2880218 RepID=UPI00247A7546|nr:alpha/beta hydrolase [Paraburkholderia sp. D15]WGS55156.1 alpha/beta hydrolase [Paraburkholderia sp. D15]
MKSKFFATCFCSLIAFAGLNQTTSAQIHEDSPMNEDIASRLAQANAALLAQCPAVQHPQGEDQLPVHITSWGTTGPTVFFVHGGVQGGLGGGPETFAAQKALSEQGWELKLIDRLGFGDSPSRGRDDMEADAKLIADNLGTSAHLVGHSWGGAEALLAAAQRPDSVRSLILIEPAVHPMLLTDPQSMADPKVKAGIEMIGRLTLEAKTPAAFAMSFAQTLGESNPSEAALMAHPETASALGCSLLRGRRATPATMRAAADAVARARIPVLVISGGYSDRQDETAEATARILHGRHVVVRSPNHFIQQANAGEFNRAIVSFMRDVDRKKGAQ